MKKKRDYSTILLVFILFAGLSLLLYPSFSDWWNSFHSSQAITNYTKQVRDMSDEDYTHIWDAAREYNHSLTLRRNDYILNEKQKKQYEELLNISGYGIMGYINIPSIKVSLPVYHGTSESVLQVAVGHLEWSSLPVGGEGSHCVLSGHRGLPSAKLFSDLDKLVVGDIFTLQVLDEILTYEVDQILIVEPDETKALHIEQGKDLCTLVTCTPYGINSHRLLVRGHRIETVEETIIRVSAEAVQIDPMLVAPAVAVPFLVLMLLYAIIPRKSKKQGGEYYEDD